MSFADHRLARLFLSPKGKSAKNMLLLQSAVVAVFWLCCVWGVLLWDLRSTQRNEKERVERELISLTEVSAQTLSSSLNVLDIALLELRREWQISPQTFDAAVRRWRQTLGMDEHLEVGIVGLDGRIRFSSADPNAVGLDVSQRESYMLFSHNSSDTLLLSAPIQALALKDRWWIPVSRPVTGPGGEFQGVISMLIPPRYFTSLYEPMLLGKSGVVSLVRFDNRILLRSIAASDHERELVTALPLPEGFTRSTVFQYDAYAENRTLTTRTRSPVDGLERVYVSRRLQNFPVAFTVGESVDHLYAELNGLYGRYIATGVVLSALVLLFMYWQWRLKLLRAHAIRQQSIQIRKLQRSTDRLQASRNALRQLHGRELLARESERQLVAQEIHDELGQRLTLLKMEMSLLPLVLQKEGLAEHDRHIERIQANLKDMLSLVRNISTRLRPVLLDVSLLVALDALVQDLVAMTGLQCSLENQLPENLRLDDAVTVTVFRIAQESLTNVVRHAKASHVTVRLQLRDQCLLLEVQDDGIGLSESVAASHRRSQGLSGMQERARALDGHLTVNSTPGKGTTVRLLLPVQQDHFPNSNEPVFS